MKNMLEYIYIVSKVLKSARRWRRSHFANWKRISVANRHVCSEKSNIELDKTHPDEEEDGAMLVLILIQGTAVFKQKGIDACQQTGEEKETGTKSQLLWPPAMLLSHGERKEQTCVKPIWQLSLKAAPANSPSFNYLLKSSARCLAVVFNSRYRRSKRKIHKD